MANGLLGSGNQNLLSLLTDPSGSGGINSIYPPTTVGQRAIGPLIGALGNIGGAYLQTRGAQKGIDERNRLALMAENRLTQAADEQRAIDLFDIQSNQDLFSGLTRPQLLQQRAAQDEYSRKQGYDVGSDAYKDLFPVRELPDILKDPNAPLFDKEGHRYHRPQLGESTAANRLNPALWPNQGIRQDKGWKSGLLDLGKKGGYALLAASVLSGFGVPGLAWAPKALKVVGSLGLGGRGGGQQQAAAAPIPIDNYGPGELVGQEQAFSSLSDVYGQEMAMEMLEAFTESRYPQTPEGLTQFYYNMLEVGNQSDASSWFNEPRGLRASAKGGGLVNTMSNVLNTAGPLINLIGGNRSIPEIPAGPIIPSGTLPPFRPFGTLPDPIGSSIQTWNQ